MENYLIHYGVLGMKWGVRRYQNEDGSYKSGAEGRYDPEYEPHPGKGTKDAKTSDKPTAKKDTYNSKFKRDDELAVSDFNKDRAKKLIKTGLIVGGTVLTVYGLYKLGETSDLSSFDGMTPPPIPGVSSAFKPVTKPEAMVSLYKNSINELSEAEKASIRKYTTNAYVAINSQLRFGEQNEVQSTIDTLTSALNKCSTTKDISTTRFTQNIDKVLGFSSMSQLKAAIADGSLIGSTFTDKGFMSTDIRSKGSVAFSGTKLTVNIPKGSKAMYIEPLSFYKGSEQEVLIQRNSSFAISNAILDGNGNIVELVIDLIDQSL